MKKYKGKKSKTWRGVMVAGNTRVVIATGKSYKRVVALIRSTEKRIMT